MSLETFNENCDAIGNAFGNALAEIREANRKLAQAEWVLTNAGFKRCDMPACNCGSWHQVGGFKLRFDEIKDAVEDAGYSTNGRTLLDTVKSIIKDADKSALKSALNACLEYLDGKVDVVDGSYGIPEPNREMSLVSEINEALGKGGY